MTTGISQTTLELGEYPPGQAPLPSWNEGRTKKSIVDFVRGVATAGDAKLVKPEERIAVFDNDGTMSLYSRDWRHGRVSGSHLHPQIHGWQEALSNVPAAGNVSYSGEHCEE
jgi:hypothetical protein